MENWPKPKSVQEELIKSQEQNKAFVDDGSKWKKITDQVVENYEHIIALRGAGANNGIDPEKLEELLREELIPRIKGMLEGGSVAIMFDGDQDSLEKPDIGAVMGRLKDEFKNEDLEKVLFLTAQKKSWYYPKDEEGNLSNANGESYITYVFEDGKYDGDHNSFTQSEKFANAEGYEQWYVGASGDIATEQLEDFNTKISGEQRRKTVVFRAPINENLQSDIEGKLAQARADEDDAKFEKFKGVLRQRENKYGAHWDNNGDPAIATDRFDKLNIELVV